MGRTLSEKVWDEHVVRSAPGEPDLLYIDLHLLHEVTSPQAFDGLRLANRVVRRPGQVDGPVERLRVDPVLEAGQPPRGQQGRGLVDVLVAGFGDAPFGGLGDAAGGELPNLVACGYLVVHGRLLRRRSRTRPPLTSAGGSAQLVCI